MPGNIIIGIDIGGTNTRLVRTSSVENPHLLDKYIFPTTKNFQVDYQKIVTYINTFSQVKGIGIGIPGNLLKDKSVVTDALYVPGHIRQPIPLLLREKFHCPVVMDNDAVVAALGEASYGIKKKTDFIYIIWGTGIGGAFVTYVHGLPKVTPIDWTTYLQQWNNLCGSKSLTKRFGKNPASLHEEEWQEIMNDFMNELVTFTRRLKSQKIIFGGGIAVKQQYRLIRMIEQHKKRLPSIHIRISALGEDAGLYGAIGLISASEK